MTDARVVATTRASIAKGASVASTDPDVDLPGVPLVATERRIVRRNAGVA